MLDNGPSLLSDMVVRLGFDVVAALTGASYAIYWTSVDGRHVASEWFETEKQQVAGRSRGEPVWLCVLEKRRAFRRMTHISTLQSDAPLPVEPNHVRIRAQLRRGIAAAPARLERCPSAFDCVDGHGCWCFQHDSHAPRGQVWHLAGDFCPAFSFYLQYILFRHLAGDFYLYISEYIYTHTCIYI